jgi:hypothetical protein
MLRSVLSAVALLAIANTSFVREANAAGVNCSFEVCMQKCLASGYGQTGCHRICEKTMLDRQSAGQCKK